ncbi:hypothetical protein C8R46DRAFT_304331 [Mycena filopes]|nr:hypothetical protein C8R46DRAFT_304331 [Mycena filopes]
MYPDGRTNPAPSHFARNMSVELHPPVSPRLLQQRYLDREGRAICRIVYSHGIGIQLIASVFCVSEDAVIQAIANKPSHGERDKAENDYWYVSNEYRNQYPSHSQTGPASPSTSTIQEKYKNHLQHSSQFTTNLDDGLVQKESPSTPSPNSSKAPVKKPIRPGTGRGRGRADDAGWVSNPTARHFRDDTPIVNHLGKNGRVDRKGRAICRIMYPHIENYSQIARIFGIGHNRVRRAVLNAYSPPDDVAQDYAHAGQDFRDEYPPLSESQEPNAGGSGEKRSRSPELDDLSNKRPKRAETATTSSSVIPKKTVVVEIPLRTRKDSSEAANVKSFLKNIGGFDLSHWQETFKAKGLTSMQDLTTLARLEESRLVKTLTRLFASQNMAEVHILLLVDALVDLGKEGA